MNLSRNGSGPLLNRRSFLAQGSMATAAIAFAQADTTVYTEVKTAYGRLRGLRQPGLVTFKGIPYAGRVSGANRFKAAPPLKPWTGVKDALQLGAPSWQPTKSYFGINEPSPDENCLVLNIWSPAADGRKRPVMFYNHGGGFYKGSGGALYQDGGNLARAHDVVVVATNHRLGLLGYLFLGDLGGEEYAASANQGLLDIRDGLQWVHENIEAFGGDPDNVMVFGESGGGLKTSCIYALPSAAKYFHKTSIESGPGVRMMTRDAAAETALRTLHELGLNKSEWRKLLDVPVDKLVAAQVALEQPPSGGFPLADTLAGNGWRLSGNFSAVVDGSVLPHDPFHPEAPAFSKNKPLMVGSNRDETMFIWFQSKSDEVFKMTDEKLKARLHQELGAKAETIYAAYRKARPNASAGDLYTAISTACMFWYPGITIAERKYAQRGAPVYMYLFVHESNFIIPGTNRSIGVPHAVEILYKLDNIHASGEKSHGDRERSFSNDVMDAMVGTDPDRQKVATNMSEMWTAFARTGVPKATGQPAWPAYTTQTRATMQIDAVCKIVNDPFGQERSMFENLPG